MKSKTKTIRIPKKLHAIIKAKASSLGMKLEAWTVKMLEAAI